MVDATRTQSIALDLNEPAFDLNKLDQIEVHVSRQERDTLATLQMKYRVSIHHLLDNYTLAIGYTNVSILSVLVALLTTGKVLVEFGAYTERLVLQDETMIMSDNEAVILYNAYLKNTRSGPSAAKRTQQIMVQAPKRKI